MAELHVASGWVPADTRVDEFEAAMRTVCEPIFERPLGEISLGALLMRLFQTSRRFNMEVQPQLVLLQKTLLAIEGLGRELYPELDLWDTGKPYLEGWMKEQVGPKALLKQFSQELPRLAETLPTLPRRLDQALNEQQQSLNALKQEIRRDSQRRLGGLMGATLIISAVLTAGLALPGYWQYLPYGIGGAGLLTWFWVLFTHRVTE